MDSIRKIIKTSGKDITLLALCFSVALAIKFYFLPFYLVISADGAGYATIARKLLQPGGLASAAFFPPFYPFLTAILNLLVNDVELAGRLVSMLMGSFLVMPLYLLGTEFFSRKVGLLACLLAITWHTLRGWSGEVMSQSTYITLAYAGAYLLWRANRSYSIKSALLSGLVIGLAYLTRPEAIIIFAAATPILIWYGLSNGRTWREAAIPPLASWLGFWVAAFPYIILLHQETGVWQLTAKSGAVLSVGLGQYLGKFDVYREPGFKPLGFLDVIRDYPGFILFNVGNNLRTIATEMLPPYYWVLALIGFLAGGWNRQKTVARLFLAATFAPLIVIIVFFLAGPEYTQLSLPVLLLWIGQGCVSIEYRLSLWSRATAFSALQAVFQRNVFSILVISILSVSTLFGQIPADRNRPYSFEQDGGRYDHKRIALLLKEYLPKDATIMTRSGRISFYAEHPSIDIPQTGFSEIIAFGRKNRARFLVVDGMLMGQRPQLEILFTPLLNAPERVFFLAQGNDYVPLAGLRLFLLYKDPSSLGVAVYEFI